MTTGLYSAIRSYGVQLKRRYKSVLPAGPAEPLLQHPLKGIAAGDSTLNLDYAGENKLDCAALSSGLVVEHPSLAIDHGDLLEGVLVLRRRHANLDRPNA